MPQLKKSLTDSTATSKYYKTFTLPHSTEDASKPNAAHEPERLGARSSSPPNKSLPLSHDYTEAKHQAYSATPLTFTSNAHKEST
jgi:hypothetical protein